MKYSMVLISVNFIYMFIISLTYFRKKKVESVEVKFYNAILIFCLFNILIELLLCVNILKGVNLYSIYNLTLNRIFLLSLFIWFTIFTLYVLLISNKNNLYVKKQFIDLPFNKGINLFLPYIVICSIFLLTLPIDLINDGIYAYSNGPVVSFLTILLGLNIISWVVLILINMKNINIKKFIPVFSSVVVLLILIIVRQINPGILLNSFSVAITTFIMYHTIENPDVKMLEEIEKNRELTEKSIEDKANMLFKITEDVKTPVSKIEILSNKIIRNDELEEIHIDARNINSLSRSVNNTINNVMNITNYDIANLKVSDISYDMYNLFKELVIMTKEKLNDKIDFSYHMSSTIPNKLYGDSLKIKQIIYTIIINAIKHTKEGTIDLTIESINRGDICRLIIEVSDTGVGMDAYKINEILESDSNLSPEEINKIKDLDVDLKITKKMIDMLGGSLLIKSEEGEGSTFTIIINQGIVDNTSKKKTINILSNKKKCLVICDDVEELEKLSLELKKNNYLVSTSLYGMDLVKEINNNYDLIFIDDEMKPHNAVEIMKEIGKTKEKIIIMLNKDKESIKEHYLNDYPFVDYLLKNNYKEEIKRIKDKY